MSLDFARRPSVRVILDRIREESRDETGVIGPNRTQNATSWVSKYTATVA